MTNQHAEEPIQLPANGKPVKSTHKTESTEGVGAYLGLADQGQVRRLQFTWPVAKYARALRLRQSDDYRISHKHLYRALAYLEDEASVTTLVFEHDVASIAENLHKIDVELRRIHDDGGNDDDAAEKGKPARMLSVILLNCYLDLERLFTSQWISTLAQSEQQEDGVWPDEDSQQAMQVEALRELSATMPKPSHAQEENDGFAADPGPGTPGRDVPGAEQGRSPLVRRDLHPSLWIQKAGQDADETFCTNGKATAKPPRWMEAAQSDAQAGEDGDGEGGQPLGSGAQSPVMQQGGDAAQERAAEPEPEPDDTS
ncbi:hypothetical protein LTR36_004137 [Oleoguttula mirabilis]|uniref:Uncharacterized protein n=1 Tax=Oleoguttula mirabilis TaxID=1507867 RepID=A0AAV9JHV4_9PEZI|nr:hypothetical protein LTR36_004137 [Oleoguttula mirabilis]